MTVVLKYYFPLMYLYISLFLNMVKDATCAFYHILLRLKCEHDRHSNILSELIIFTLNMVYNKMSLKCTLRMKLDLNLFYLCIGNKIILELNLIV